MDGITNLTVPEMLPAMEDALGLAYKLWRELRNGQCRTVTKECLKLLHCLSTESSGSHFLYAGLNLNTLEEHDSYGQRQFKTVVLNFISPIKFMQ
jgi:hypothetical protein